MKKAQAAMEFLMTYGWAILVVLIAIGALAYFGVLNPQRFLPESCTIGPGISCDDFQVLAAGTGTLILRNGMGAELDTLALTIVEGSPTATDVAGTCTPITDWAAGSQMTCTFTGLETGSAGSRFQKDLALTYTEQGSTLSHTKRGTLSIKYE